MGRAATGVGTRTSCFFRQICSAEQQMDTRRVEGYRTQRGRQAGREGRIPDKHDELQQEQLVEYSLSVEGPQTGPQAIHPQGHPSGSRPAADTCSEREARVSIGCP